MSDAVIKISSSRSNMGHEIKVQVVERPGAGSQYTITIPRPIAEAWGLKKGDVVDFQFGEDGKVTLHKKQG